MYGNLAQIGRSGYQFVTANWGDLTGDYIGGVRLQESMDIIGAVAGIGISFAVGGPVGAVAASVGVALNYATQLGSEYIQAQKTNAVNAVARERYGISTKGGGR